MMPCTLSRSTRHELTEVTSRGLIAVGAGKESISGRSTESISRIEPTTWAGTLYWFGTGGRLTTTGSLTSTISGPTAVGLSWLI